MGDLRVMSLVLRMTAVLAAIALVFTGTGHGLALFRPALFLYVVSSALLGLLSLRGLVRSDSAFWVHLDAAFVASILYEHLLGTPVTQPHGLTTASLVIPFLFLSHVGMTLRGRLILSFAGAVLSAWLLMLAVMAWRHENHASGGFAQVFLSLDLGLALTFALTALSTSLLALDHKRAQQRMTQVNRWRHNLARFFPPRVVTALQEAGHQLALQRRPAAIMFVDLRGFTQYAEHAPPDQLAQVLTGYRQIVTDVVNAWDGTIDKFMGDGVMAVFGQPVARADDARRALHCALVLNEKLAAWKPLQEDRNQLFRAGIGLHYGIVVGGVLDSGSHDEFTVFGDAVNVARRLESMSKELNAGLVVSLALLTRVPPGARGGCWRVRRAVTLKGRRIPIDVAYRSRAGHNSGAQESPVRDFSLIAVHSEERPSA